MHGTQFRVRENLYLRYKSGLPRKFRPDSRYGLCFRICLAHQITEMARRLSTHKKFADTRLYVVMESGHNNSKDAERIFHEFKKKMGDASPLLASITFSAKDDCDPLMIADFLAHSAFIKTDAEIALMESGFIPATKERTGLTYFEYGENGIETMLEEIHKKHEARLTWGARRSGPYQPRS
jgi:hypothetical protein